MRVFLLFLVVSAGCAAEPLTPVLPQQLVDRSIRYVSGKVITLGDLVDHLQSNRPKDPPTTQAGVAELWRKSLDRVTDETLLVLFAQEKGVVLDRQQIGSRILSDLKTSGRLAAPDEVERWRKQLERREMIRAALSFFDLRSGNVTPDELVAAYNERKKQFRRPARAQVLQFVLRAASAEEIATVNDAHATWFRKIQGQPGPLADLAAANLDALIAVVDDEEAKSAQLAKVAEQAALLPDDGLQKAGRALRDEAKQLVQRLAKLRTTEEVVAQTKALMEPLAKGDEAGFRALVKAHSEGPRREDGGDLGWIERGAYTPAFDEAVFDGPVGTVGEPFWVGEAYCLTWVVSRDDASQRSFAEVCGELETALRRERTDEVFDRAAGILRSRATIRDLASIDELLAQ